jgi:ribonuclease HI
VIIAAADGSSLSNPGPAGWAWVVGPDRWAAGGWPHGTNNMGELMAVLDLLNQSAGSGEALHVVCDSQYAINVCTLWLPQWKARGWRKADKKPILNLDLVQALDQALQGRRVTFEWVKGHAGHPLNEQADFRARSAAEAYQQGRTPNAGPGWGGTDTPGRGGVKTAEAAGPKGVKTVQPALTPELEPEAQPTLFD